MININKGFTLAELLAVVIIVALMASFSAGYYSKSKAQAKFTEVLDEANRDAERTNQAAIDLAMEGGSITYGPYSSGNYGQSCDATSHYCIQVATDYVTDVPRGRVACVPDDGANGRGQAFCETMGYANCKAEGSAIICTRGVPSGN